MQTWGLSLRATLLKVAALGCQQKLTAPAHVAHSLLDEAAGQVPGCAAQASQVLGPALPLAARELPLLLSQTAVDLAPDGVVHGVQVWTTLGNAQDVDAARGFGGLALAGLEPGGIVVLQDHVRPLPGPHTLQRRLQSTRVHVSRCLPGPTSRRHSVPQEHLTVPHCPHNEGALGASVARRALLGFDVAPAEALPWSAEGAEGAVLRSLGASCCVEVSLEKLAIQKTMHVLVPPLSRLGFVAPGKG